MVGYHALLRLFCRQRPVYSHFMKVSNEKYMLEDGPGLERQKVSGNELKQCWHRDWEVGLPSWDISEVPKCHRKRRGHHEYCIIASSLISKLNIGDVEYFFLSRIFTL